MSKKLYKLKSKLGIPALNRAAALLVTILIISAITLAIALSISLGGIGEMQMGTGLGQSDKAQGWAEACMDEALLQLIRNPNYNGGDLILDEGSCNINIDKSGPNPIITVSGKFKEFTKKITVKFDLANKKILSWQEI